LGFVFQEISPGNFKIVLYHFILKIRFIYSDFKLSTGLLRAVRHTCQPTVRKVTAVTIIKAKITVTIDTFTR